MRISLAPARVTLTASLTVAVLALVGCAGSISTPAGPLSSDGGATDLRGEWRFDGGTLDGDPVVLDDFPVTMVFDNGSARVRTGCFSYDQPMTPDLDVVLASARTQAQPQASCMALGESADAAIKSLENVTAASRNGDLLSLTGDDLALEFTLVPAVDADDVVGVWQLQGALFGDAMLSPLGEGPEIEFASDGTVTGSTGCAEFSGTYEVVSGMNQVGDLEYVEGMCVAEETQTMIDTNIREVLDNGFLVHLDDGTLSLVSSTTDTSLKYSPRV